MGRLLVVRRLAARDIRRRPGEAALLLLVLMAATTVLTLGLLIRGVTSDPYLRTRDATAGPDVVLSAGPTGGTRNQPPDTPADAAVLRELALEPDVVEHSGPHPVAFANLEVNGRTGAVFAIGRDTTPSAVDQPQLTAGTWIKEGAVVVEAAFADALGVDVGDSVSLNSERFDVAGIAITAAAPPYPEISCFADTCFERTGVMWLTQSDVSSLPPSRMARPDGPPVSRDATLAYVMFLKLTNPGRARAFVDAHADDPRIPTSMAWQDIRDQTAEVVRNQREVLVIGSRLISLLAIASVAVLAGGRMAGQIRRVGLLKAVGGTPGLAAAVLLAEYVTIALFAAGAGLAAGWLIAPLLTDPSIGLLGGAGTPPLTMSTAAQVTAVALGVTGVAALVPAVRAARTSTVHALADAARPPRRTPWLIAMSARLPVPLLLGLRIAARRPRRTLLSTASMFVTVSGIVAALGAHALPEVERLGEFGLPGTRTAQLNQALLMITIILAALAAINAVFIASASVIDNRHASALTRALGATPHDLSSGLSAAELLPALIGALLGVPGGMLLLGAVSDETATPPLWQLLAVVPASVFVVAALTTVPARLGARRPVIETLQSELA
jgi:ABC-type lipoprotein release transport system permease subunit